MKTTRNRHRKQQHTFKKHLLKVDNTSEKNMNNNVNKHKQLKNSSNRIKRKSYKL